MIALVTGASSGIGFEMAKELSKRGYDIIAVAREKAKLEKLKKKIKTNIIYIVKDLSDENECVELYNEVKKYNVDILVNNAGFGDYGFFETTKIDNDMSMINVNIRAVHILTKLFLKDMKERNEGYILNMSSLASFTPGPLMAEYYATKAYVTKLTTSIAKEINTSKSNVHISVVCPGPVDTNFNNVAGVAFSVKPLTAEYVAKYALNKMFKNKLMIIPGFFNKLAAFFSRITPDFILSAVTYNIQKRKRR